MTDLDNSIQRLSTNFEETATFYCKIPTQPEQLHDFVVQCHELLPDKLHKASIGRRGEYIAGRLAARAALAELSILDFNVLKDADGSPIWPDSVQGSISHKEQLAVAIASKSFRYVGIDLESHMSHKKAVKLADKITNEKEQEVIRNSILEFSDGFTRTFSAKEAIYKAVYPYVKRYLPFNVCEVTHIDEQGLTLALQSSLTAEIHKKTGHQITSFNIKTTSLEDKVLSFILN